MNATLPMIFNLPAREVPRLWREIRRVFSPLMNANQLVPNHSPQWGVARLSGERWVSFGIPFGRMKIHADFVAIVPDRDYGGARKSQPDLDRLTAVVDPKYCVSAVSHESNLAFCFGHQDNLCCLDTFGADGRPLHSYIFARFDPPAARR